MTYAIIAPPFPAGVTVIYRLEDGAFIPSDPLNRDHIAYQAWLAEGNEPATLEAAPPPTGAPTGAPTD